LKIDTINNKKFYRVFDVCEKEDLDNLKKLIDLQFASQNIVWTRPLYQTTNNLHLIFKDNKSFNKLKNTVVKTVHTHIDKALNLNKCWVNLAAENNTYAFHTHNTPLTCVFYLQCKDSVYGTSLEEEKIIIPAIPNSILMFKGSISHSITLMPNKVFTGIDCHRYSIVFDFLKKS
jgi:hypothetical protein